VFPIQLTKAREFRRYIEDHYQFGDFALIRGREETAEIGFVFADEDVSNWPFLYKKADYICDHFEKRLKEEGLNSAAHSRVGKDLDFITVSIVIHLQTFPEDEIHHIADIIMNILREINPYHKNEN